MARYLVIAHFNPGQAKHADVRNAANQSKNWVQQNSAAIEAAYTFTTSDPTGGGAAIVQANSSAELQAMLRSNPSNPHVRYEIHELSDYNAGIDQYNSELPG
jgi:hypothetical protein